MPARESESTTNAPAAADFAVIGGRIWTGSGPDVQALACRGGRVIAVGRDRDIRPLIGPGTNVLSAGGRRVIPGLADAHLHLIPGGLRLSRLDLGETTGRESFAAAVSRHAQALAPAAWIEGAGWSDDRWRDRASPTRAWIDGATGDHPAFLFRFDCHAALVNSRALAIAGIDVHGPADPPGGAIDRDPQTREPTGLLRDTAMQLVTRHIPPPADTDRINAIHAAIALAHRHGITMVHNMLDPPDLPALMQMLAGADPARTPPIRMYTILHRRPTADIIELWRSLNADLARRPAPVADDFLRFGACKNYMDGSLGSRTAWMLEPYVDGHVNPGTRNSSPCGLRLDGADSGDDLRREFLAADAAGLQLCAHAIGDAAVHELLNQIERLPAAAHRNRRPRVEHAQHVAGADVARLGRLGAIASMQPYHKFEDGPIIDRALGSRRAATAYRFHDLLGAGAVLAFGSDWPIVPINPFAGMAVAVTGRTRDGATWHPEQNLTVREALRAYTQGAAHAAFMEDRVGKLLPGFWCDLAELDRDILHVDPGDLTETRVLTTVVGGRVVWAV